MARSEHSDLFRSIRQQAEEADWTVHVTARNRFQFMPPDKTQSPVVFAGSPGDFRAIRNFVARLRKRGLNVNANQRSPRKKK